MCERSRVDPAIPDSVGGRLAPVADELAVPEPLEPVDDTDRVAAISRLHDLVAGGGLSLDRFSSGLEQVLAATSREELEAAMTVMPSLVRLTPGSRRLAQPLRVDAGIRRLDLGAGWQLASETSITTSTGKCGVDLTQASWDAREINLSLETATGRIEVVIPEGVAVQVVSARGRVTLESLTPPVPGAPILRVTAAASTGRILIRHPRKPRPRRWLRRRHRTA